MSLQSQRVILCGYDYLPDDYYCVIENQEISDKYKLIIAGSHQGINTNDNVIGVWIKQCKMTRIPQDLTEIYPNIRRLDIFDSNLSQLTKDDLAEYKNFERIYLNWNKIEFLPGDIFEGFLNLKRISFWANQIKIIEPNILDGLDEIEVVDFRENTNYNLFYSSLPDCYSTATLDDVKNELSLEFLASTSQEIENKHAELKHVNSEPKDLKEDSLYDVTIEVLNFILHDQNLKDFKIVVEDQEFHVHKFLLIARSPTLAELLSTKPEAESLNLTGIPKKIFENILNFIYTDKLPSDTNFLQLFEAAGELKIEKLKNFAAMNLYNQVNSQNMLAVLALSQKYGHKELKKKALDLISMNFTDASDSD